jgi:hypothetical protein
MHITTVKSNNKLQILKTININLPSAKVSKEKRLTLSQMIEQRKRATRDARLVQILTR